MSHTEDEIKREHEKVLTHMREVERLERKRHDEAKKMAHEAKAAEEKARLKRKELEHGQSH